MDNSSTYTFSVLTKVKKYPIRCVECGHKLVQPSSIHYKMGDIVIENLPVNCCGACGEVYFTIESDNIIASSRQKHN